MLPFPIISNTHEIISVKNVQSGSSFYSVLMSTGNLYSQGTNTNYQMGGSSLGTTYNTLTLMDTGVSNFWCTSTGTFVVKNNILYFSGLPLGTSGGTNTIFGSTSVYQKVITLPDGVQANDIIKMSSNSTIGYYCFITTSGTIWYTWSSVQVWTSYVPSIAVTDIVMCTHNRAIYVNSTGLTVYQHITTSTSNVPTLSSSTGVISFTGYINFNYNTDATHTYNGTTKVLTVSTGASTSNTYSNVPSYKHFSYMDSPSLPTSNSHSNIIYFNNTANSNPSTTYRCIYWSILYNFTSSTIKEWSSNGNNRICLTDTNKVFLSPRYGSLVELDVTVLT